MKKYNKNYTNKTANNKINKETKERKKQHMHDHSNKPLRTAGSGLLHLDQYYTFYLLKWEVSGGF